VKIGNDLYAYFIERQTDRYTENEYTGRTQRHPVVRKESVFGRQKKWLQKCYAFGGLHYKKITIVVICSFLSAYKTADD
jgi:hypothetical protein